MDTDADILLNAGSLWRTKGTNTRQTQEAVITLRCDSIVRAFKSGAMGATSGLSPLCRPINSIFTSDQSDLGVLPFTSRHFQLMWYVSLGRNKNAFIDISVIWYLFCSCECLTHYVILYLFVFLY